MMEFMTKEDSYADRRVLFKNIWDTAMQMGEKDVDSIMNKPKVIKTLRVDEMDRHLIGKGKKERIKNLRAVCKKILNFCDRQDADDMKHEQVLKKPEKKETKESEEQPQHELYSIYEKDTKKVKKYRKRKKLKMSPGRQATTSERKDDYPRIFGNSSGKKHFVKRTSVSHKKALRTKSDPNAEGVPAGERATHRKIKRKKCSKRKKTSSTNLSLPTRVLR